MALTYCSDDDDDDDLLSKGVLKDLEALKEASQLSGLSSSPDYGDFTPHEFGAESEDEDDIEEDDDELLLSIQKRFGSSPRGAFKAQNELHVTYEEEDDDDILRAVEKRFATLDRLEAKAQLVSRVKAGRSKSEDTKEKNKASIHRQRLRKDVSETLEHIQGAINANSKVDDVVSFGSDDGASSICCDEAATKASKVGLTLPGQVELFDDTSAGLSVNPVDDVVHDINTSDLPENTRSVIDALKKNRLCQKVLRNRLAQVESKLEENKELMRRVRTLIDFEKICRRRFAGFLAIESNPSVKLIATSNRRGKLAKSMEIADHRLRGPPENEDVAKLRALQMKFPLSFEVRPWSKEEKRELRKGVKQQVQENFVRSAMESFNANGNLEETFDERMKTLAGKSYTAAELRAALPDIKWNDVARIYVVGRSAMECKMQWLNHEDPFINHGSWSKAEDKRLLSISQQHEFCQWEDTAQELGTHRTPAQCITRYQRSLNAHIMRGAWKPQEDEQLRAAVELYGERDWQTVATRMEGRTGSQCFNRWYKYVHPTRHKLGRWDLEEDKRLRWAVSVYGPRKWKNIAAHVPGRSEVQCRERWCNVLDPNLKLEEWTEAEDKKLEEAVAKHGMHHWCAVANDLKPRTDNQCWRRWKIIHKEHIIAFKKDVQIRKLALISNFVGRTRERPRLGPSDFIRESSVFPEIQETVSKKQKILRARKHEVNSKETRDNAGKKGKNVCDNAGKKRKRLVGDMGDRTSVNDVPCEVLPPWGISPEYARARRQARMIKMRLARSTGRMHCMSIKKRPDTTTPELANVGGTAHGCSNLENIADVCNGYLPVVIQDSRQGLQQTDLAVHDPHAAIAFTGLVAAIADLCEGTCNANRVVSPCADFTSANIRSSISNRTEHSYEPIKEKENNALVMYENTEVESQVEDQRVGFMKPDQVQSHHDTAQEVALMNAWDKEVAVAAKAILSWPFFVGMQEIWTGECTRASRVCAKKRNGKSHVKGASQPS